MLNIRSKKYLRNLHLYLPYIPSGVLLQLMNSLNGDIRTRRNILAADTVLKSIHNIRIRMPDILSRKNEGTWLQNDLRTEQIISILSSYDTWEMEAYTVSNVFSKIGYNTTASDVFNESYYPELPSLEIQDIAIII